jgi:hypothetical protein
VELVQKLTDCSEQEAKGVVRAELECVFALYNERADGDDDRLVVGALKVYFVDLLGPPEETQRVKEFLKEVHPNDPDSQILAAINDLA